jgi:GDPmannose 4,6-dehydratase
MKKALIIGCNGQDGRLLYENLSQKGYHVTGVARPSQHGPAHDWRTSLDISDREAVFDLIKKVGPDEIYYLAAYHHSSENMPTQDNGELFNKSFQVHVLSLVNFLEGMRTYAKDSRLFYAASSHIFGNPAIEPQDEQTPFSPKCIYGITKTAGIHTCRFYRNRDRLFVSTGILYNHESPYRKPIFVTRKIIDSAIRIKNKQQDKLVLGNLSAEVDWGYAPDYVDAFHRIVNAAAPDDFVIATGKKHSVRDFVEITFGYLGLDWKKCVEEDKNIIAKNVVSLVGDSQKLMRTTGWAPSVDLKAMIRLLLLAEGALLND